LKKNDFKFNIFKGLKMNKYEITYQLTGLCTICHVRIVGHSFTKKQCDTCFIKHFVQEDIENMYYIDEKLDEHKVEIEGSEDYEDFEDYEEYMQYLYNTREDSIECVSALMLKDIHPPCPLWDFEYDSDIILEVIEICGNINY
jgi:hypothetical protein